MICGHLAHARAAFCFGLKNGASAPARLLASLVLLMLGASAMATGAVGFHGVVVNGVTQPGFALLLLDDRARPYLAYKDFIALGFSMELPRVVMDDLELVPLYGHEGMVVVIDAKQSMVFLEVEPHWYARTRMDLNTTQSGQPLPAQPGALLNYSIQASRSGEAEVNLGSSQSLSLFGSAGLLQLTTAMTSINLNQTSTVSPPERKFIRLGTTFLRDDTEHLTTLSVGDGVLQASVGTPGVRYGGFSWQSNFGLNPAFSTLETPTLFDSARLPSTLEFFLNDRRVGTPVAVAPGAFEISGLPTVGVNGTLQVLIRDALHNERIVAVPYLHTASLYRQGLHSFSYTAGLLRPDLDQYDTPFIASSHRWGLLRWLTLDAGATLSKNQSSVGVGATTALSGNVKGDVNLALSNSQAGAGQKVNASAQWQDSIGSIGASYSNSSPGFGLLGDSLSLQARPQDEKRLFAARALGQDLGSVSISFGSLSTWSGNTRSISSLGWSRSFAGVNLSLSAVHTTDGTLLQLSVNVPLERHAFLSGSVQTQEGGIAVRTHYATAHVMGKGIAWHLGMTAVDPNTPNEQASFAATVDARSDFGEYGLDLDSRPNEQSWRTRMAGSLGVLAGRRFIGPPITGGFALVSTGDAPNIPVYRWNLPVTVSDASGLALVTTLSPYQKNLLTVKPEDVPLQYRVANSEITAIPGGRGGVLVNFAIVRERPAMLVLELPNGHALPVGATVFVPATGESSPVGMRGEVYLQNLPEHSELLVRLKEEWCQVTIAFPSTTDPQPRLGPYVCALHGAP